MYDDTAFVTLQEKEELRVKRVLIVSGHLMCPFFFQYWPSVPFLPIFTHISLFILLFSILLENWNWADSNKSRNQSRPLWKANVRSEYWFYDSGVVSSKAGSGGSWEPRAQANFSPGKESRPLSSWILRPMVSINIFLSTVTLDSWRELWVFRSRLLDPNPSNWLYSGSPDFPLLQGLDNCWFMQLLRTLLTVRFYVYCGGRNSY